MASEGFHRSYKAQSTTTACSTPPALPSSSLPTSTNPPAIANGTRLSLGFQTVGKIRARSDRQSFTHKCSVQYLARPMKTCTLGRTWLRRLCAGRSLCRRRLFRLKDPIRRIYPHHAGCFKSVDVMAANKVA